MSSGLGHYRLPFAVIAALLLCSCGEGGKKPQALPKLTTEGQRAYKTLLVADTFSDDAVGEAGEIPDTVRAFRLLLKETEADMAFKRLVSEATLPGQLYGL